MAMIACEECGQEVSSAARSCPNCGCPTLFKKKRPTGVILLAVLCFLQAASWSLIGGLGLPDMVSDSDLAGAGFLAWLLTACLFVGPWIILGIGLLRLRRWARLLLMIGPGVVSVSLIFLVGFLNSLTDEAALPPVIAAFLGIVVFAWILLLWYFSKRNVKEAFGLSAAPSES